MRIVCETAPCAGPVLACAARKPGPPRPLDTRRPDNLPCCGRSGMVKSRQHPALLDPVNQAIHEQIVNEIQTSSRRPSGSTRMRKSWYDTSVVLLQPPTTREAATEIL